VVASPVFAAGGASSTRPPLGPALVAEWVATASCPVYALGGIGASNARSLIGCGACGIAGVSAIQAAFGRA
jgi:thiamine-phosphate pyrophosphorylase